MTAGDYIRLGIQRFPDQIFHQVFEGTTGACAVGCLTWAIGRDLGTGSFDLGLGLDHSSVCPVVCPVCECDQLTVWDQLIHLNDYHRWTREAIARWVDTLPQTDTMPPLAAQA